jgi:uncharacterized protein
MSRPDHDILKRQLAAGGRPSLDEIARTIVEGVHPRRVLVFGSRARGDDKMDSDVDLMVEMECDLPPAERMRRIYRLFGPRRWSMDVVVHTPEEVRQQRAQRNSLVRTIEAEGGVLYEQP